MALKGRRWLGAVLLGAAAYYGAARIGYAIGFVHGTVSAVWPPTGVALALVWIGGPRMLPAVFIGELTCDLTNGSPLAVSLAFAVGSSCEALAGYALLKRTRFRSQLDRVRDVLALLVLAALVSPIASATIATVTLLINGEITSHDLWATWHVWWLGDVTGDVIVAPLLLVLASTSLRPPRGWRLAEATSFVATVAALALVAHRLTLGVAYLVLPVLIWAALRFRQQGAVFANAVLAGASVIGAASVVSALARVSVLERILFTQNFVLVGAVTTLVLAAVISERDRAALGLEHAQARASAMAAERAALGQIATAIAREQATEKVLALVTRHAADLLQADGAALVRADGATRTTIAEWGTGADRTGCAADRGQVSAPVCRGQRLWGRLVLSAVPDEKLAAGGQQLTESLADLAALAIFNAEARDRLLTEASTDALTGLANQRTFRRRMAEESARARRYGRQLAVVLLDLDQFKKINDAAGHLTGDLVLAEVVRRVNTAVRGDELAARLGGDELAVLLPESDAEAAYTAAERVRQAVSATPIGPRSKITLSAGVADLTCALRDEEMLQRADAALYAAKRLGGDNCVVYEPEPALDTTRSAPSGRLA